MYSEVIQFYIYIYIQIIFHYRLLQYIEYISLYYTVNPYCFMWFVSVNLILLSYHYYLFYLPYCMEPISFQMSVCCFNCQALQQTVLLWRISKGRVSGQVVLEAVRALPENSSTHVSCL